MKNYITIILLFFSSIINLCAQKEIKKIKFIVGLSSPELIHAGVTYRIANISQLGVSVGAGPTWGGIWPTINFEHRLYLLKNSDKTNEKTWFFRQGTTFFPSANAPQQFSLTLTIGKDVLFKKMGRGITIDAGVFFLAESENSSEPDGESFQLWPALRFEFYF